MMNIIYISIIYTVILRTNVKTEVSTATCVNNNVISLPTLNNIVTSLAPELEGKHKGDAGKICIIGGSVEYTGAPYFAAISALKVGADLVYVVTTEGAAPVIKSYSPDLIVYPYLNMKSASKINAILQKVDVIVIGPGLGRDDEALKLIYDIINTSKSLQKPLVIDADGLYAVAKNPLVLKNYPSPGVIMTPNQREANRIMQATTNNSSWYHYWGNNVSVIVKGEKDEFYCSSEKLNWSSLQGGSGRRAGGQGDILSGSLGTIYNWALKRKLCNTSHNPQLSQSAATYAAARLTRTCNTKAFAQYGRSMTASNMIEFIHAAFQEVLVNNSNDYTYV